MTDTAKATKAKEADVETVTMTDARVVEFAGKRKMLKDVIITPEGKVQVRIDWRNGETRLFTVPDAFLLKFAGHGASQKLGDEIAGLKGENGAEIEIDDCVLAVDELIDRLYNGEWSVKKESNGLAGTSILIRALVELYAGSKTVEYVKKFLKDKTQAEKNALRNNAKVKPIVERLEAERAAKSTKKVDTDALLLQLDNMADAPEVGAALTGQDDSQTDGDEQVS